jgi:hypothetical protein
MRLPTRCASLIVHCADANASARGCVSIGQASKNRTAAGVLQPRYLEKLGCVEIKNPVSY